MIKSIIATVGVGLLSTGIALGAPTPAQKCQAGKNKAAGKYAQCRQTAEGKLARTGDSVKYATAIAKCEQKFASKWQKIIDVTTAASATCPDAPLTATQFKSVIDDHTQNIATALGGGGFVVCPTAILLKTGQTVAYHVGDDGDLGRGASRMYVDNGDGTISDLATGLMWEKKSNDTSLLHHYLGAFSWNDAFDLIDQLNNTCENDETVDCAANGDADCIGVGGQCGFAGYRDWRLPNITELYTLVDHGLPSPPAIDSIFNSNCSVGCSVTTCSCTIATFYWSGTTFAQTLTHAWYADFNNGVLGPIAKSTAGPVRAVRAGQ